MFGSKLGLPELIVLIVIPVLYTGIIYVIGKKVGYGKALRDVAQGKFPALNAQKST